MAIIIESLIHTVDPHAPATSGSRRSRNAIAGGIAVLVALPLAILIWLVLEGASRGMGRF
jgi:hypothetical protein